MIGSLILAVFLFFIMTTVSREFFEEPKSTGYRRAAIFGVGVVIINTIAIKTPAVLAVICMPVVLAGMVCMFVWWKKEGSLLKEFLCFLLMDGILAVVLHNTMLRVRDITEVRWLNAVAISVSWIAMIMSAGFMIADMIWHYEALEDYEKEVEEDETADIE